MINSPCVGLCVCDDNDICIGCKRTLDEIASWISMTEEEKLICIGNCGKRKSI